MDKLKLFKQQVTKRLTETVNEIDDHAKLVHFATSILHLHEELSERLAAIAKNGGGEGYTLGKYADGETGYCYNLNEKPAAATVVTKELKKLKENFFNSWIKDPP